MGKRENVANQNMENILAFIKEYIKKHAYPPTIREIMEGTGFKSTSTVQAYIQKMIDIGWLETDVINNSAARALRVPGYEFREMEK